MDSVSPENMDSSSQEGAGAGAGGSLSFYGKHRLAAAVSLLHNQIEFIQKEIDQLDTTPQSSIVCSELVAAVESVPDPLLPAPLATANANWDRWFKGAHSSRSGHRRWI